VVVGAAIELLARAVPDWTLEEQLAQYKAGMRFLNSNGITSTVDGGIDSADIRVLRHLVNKGEQTLRVGVMYRPDTSIAADPAKWEQAMKANGASSGFGDEWLRFAGVKLAMDGGMTLRTALTRKAYPDDPKYFGMAYLNPSDSRRSSRSPTATAGGSACTWSATRPRTSRSTRTRRSTRRARSQASASS
jgi:predicted amidohydrolase YtcJ